MGEGVEVGLHVITQAVVLWPPPHHLLPVGRFCETAGVSRPAWKARLETLWLTEGMFQHYLEVGGFLWAEGRAGRGGLTCHLTPNSIPLVCSDVGD